MTVAAWDLGNTIRSSRIKKGYTQEALSELLDITPSHLKQMEGGRRNPSVPLLFQMMELLLRNPRQLIPTTAIPLTAGILRRQEEQRQTAAWK